MTSNRTHDVQKYKFMAGEPIVLDANIWLKLYTPPVNISRERQSVLYSWAFGQILSAKAEIILESTIISEYVNRYLRIEFAPFKGKYRDDFKSFRKSADFVGCSKAAFSNVRHMMKRSSLRDTPFSGVNHADLVAGAESGIFDFNDGVLLESCRINRWKLLTHDGDMKVGDVDVITGNHALLVGAI